MSYLSLSLYLQANLYHQRYKTHSSIFHHPRKRLCIESWNHRWTTLFHYLSLLLNFKIILKIWQTFYLTSINFYLIQKLKNTGTDNTGAVSCSHMIFKKAFLKSLKILKTCLEYVMSFHQDWSKKYFFSPEKLLKNHQFF